MEVSSRANSFAEGVYLRSAIDGPDNIATASTSSQAGIPRHRGRDKKASAKSSSDKQKIEGQLYLRSGPRPPLPQDISLSSFFRVLQEGLAQCGQAQRRAVKFDVDLRGTLV